jgi:phage protein D
MPPLKAAMDLDPFKPTFLISIEGKTLSKDITQEITAFVFEDNEDELDVIELCIADRNLQFVDDPLFQEGNEIVARWGYVNNLGPKKKAVIKDIDYEFPDSGDPRIRIKAYDKGFQLAGKENQKVWTKNPPGILYSEIAEEIAKRYGLTPKVKATKVRHLRVVQSNQSDAHFLKCLCEKSRDRDGDGVTGYVFFVQDDELHFHPRKLDEEPVLALEYFTDKKGVLRSFSPRAQSEASKATGTETKAIGVDPRKKESVQHEANNDTTPDRTVLGQRTYLVDGNSGEAKYIEQESGQIVPSFDRSEGFHEEPSQEPAQDQAEGRFLEAEHKQIEARALTIGIPTLWAKHNVEVKGVGQKFSGIYWIHSIRHRIDDGGYACEIQLRKNAVGKGAGKKSDESKGRQNDKPAPETQKEEPPSMVAVDADSGETTGP